MNIGEIVKINVLHWEHSFIYGIIIYLSDIHNTVRALEDHTENTLVAKHLIIDCKYDFYSWQLMPISEEEVKRLQKIVVFS
jgi:hypothetical protein